MSISWAAPARAPGPVPVPISDDAAREAFKKGVTLFHQKQFEGAARALTEVPELGGYLSLYKHWFLGQSLMELGKFKEAEPEFAKIVQSQGSSEMKYSAQFFYAEIAMRQKKFVDAANRLAPLERKWRRSHRYPEVLSRLLVADLHRGQVGGACARALKLYTKYPAHSVVSTWGQDLSEAIVEGKRLGCRGSQKDFAARVRSLQWSGESEKAGREIGERLAKVPEEGEQRRELDLLLAGFMVNEGNVEDALNIVVRYYPQLKSNQPYLMLLGKAAARSGQYQMAVGAFERAYDLSPKSKKGREALYQAAFMSYQFQDYDGAVRKFQQFTKSNPKSGLAKDAQWHLAWLQYLRSDFKGALERFSQVSKSATARHRRDSSLQERLLYWMGMSHVRLSQLEEARGDFEQIVARNAYSYYGIAAQARLGVVVAKIAENNRRLPASPTPVALETPKDMPSQEAQADTSEEAESEEDIGAGAEADEGGDGEVEEERIQASDFKDPAVRARIDVALKLIDLGLPELAKWELWEVERRTRNLQYLRSLISAYESIQSYNRSVTIADLAFARERETGGFDSARGLWLSAYPQAYKKVVEKSARDLGVASEWVWAFMRTESMFRPDVISPVGARGLMQLMQYTARNLVRLRGESTENPDLLNPEINIPLGAQYLARLQGKFKGQLPLVAAAYNAGPHRVEGWLINFGQLDTDEFVEHIPFLETRNYVKKVVRYHTVYRRLYARDKTRVDYLVRPLGVPIPSRPPTRESWESH